MEFYSNRWEITKEWSEGYRHFVSATCRQCNEHVEKMRRESVTGKRTRNCECTRKVRGKPFEKGEKFGRLTVIDRAKDVGKNAFWNVVCDCGTNKAIQASSLRSPGVKSCGCYLAEKLGRPPEKHGMSRTKEHITWCGIVGRTQCAQESTREWYFDKGIGMSPEWRLSFTKFFEDMGPCPEGYSIDRIDTAGNYCKENCRWASIELQSINKGTFKNNTSGSTGVSQTKTGSYVAYIYHNYGRIHLGTFKQIGDAINARKQAEETYWGEINE